TFRSCCSAGRPPSTRRRRWRWARTAICRSRSTARSSSSTSRPSWRIPRQNRSSLRPLPPRRGRRRRRRETRIRRFPQGPPRPPQAPAAASRPPPPAPDDDEDIPLDEEVVEEVAAPTPTPLRPVPSSAHKPALSVVPPPGDGGEALLREALSKASREVIEKIA